MLPKQLEAVQLLVTEDPLAPPEPDDIPYQKKITDAVREDDVIFAMHTCGLCEDVLDDYAEMGVQMWSSAQPINDIPVLREKHCGKIASHELALTAL